MSSHLHFFIGIWLAVFVLSVKSQLSCERFYLGGLDEKYVAFAQLGGVYKLTQLRWHDFPVLESENSPGDYFYFNRDVNQFFVGRNSSSSLGFGATARGGSVPVAPGPADDVLWISSDPDQPFENVLGDWFQYDYVKQGNYLIPNGTYWKTTQIGLKCIPDEIQMRTCFSGRLSIADPVTWHDRTAGVSVEVNIPGVHAWEVVPGVYNDLRPVYRRVVLTPSGGPADGGDAYLYYDAYLFGTWNVGPDYSQRGAYLYVRDTALSPEFITGQWYIKHHRESAQPMPASFGLQCVGVENTTCTAGLCKNGGTCLQPQNQEDFWCLCAEGYTGTYCEQTLPSCPRITGSVFPPNTHTALFDGLDSGSIATFVCKQGFTPQFFYSRCVTSSSAPSTTDWEHYGACSLNTTQSTRAPTTTTTRSYGDYDDDDDDEIEKFEEPAWVYPVVVTALVFLEVCGPAAIWAFCSRGMGFGRIMSLFYWILSWILLFYAVPCGATKCGLYSDSLSVTLTISIISIPIMYILILFETLKSAETAYISNLGKTDTVSKSIQKLRQAQPCIVWHVCCYHYETRTRTVYYTDSSGRQQSRLETYQQMVVTHTESEVFSFSHWFDASENEVKGIEKYKITRIKLEKVILAGDQQTRNAMDRQRQAFQDRNRHRDLYMTFNENQYIPGFEKRFAAYVDESANSWWVGGYQFFLATILWCTWPYRWYFNHKSGKTNYTLIKNIYISRPETLPLSDLTAYCADAVELPPPEENVASDGDAKQEAEGSDRLTTMPV